MSSFSIRQVLLVFSCYQILQGEATWHKLNFGLPACFEARNNRPGYVTYRGSQGILVGALKLVHRSGHVRCVSDVAYNSRWGCHGYSSLKSYPLNVVVTDEKNNLIFPLPQFIKLSSSLWYEMPVVDDLHSVELVFSNFDFPLYLQPHMELRVWYGEDLKNSYEGDNQGRVCVDVSGYVIGDIGDGYGGSLGGRSSQAQALLIDLKERLGNIMHKNWK